MAQEIYSITTNFPAATISAVCLHSEINNSAIVNPLEGIVIEGDVVTIYLTGILTPGDKLLLDNIVVTHDNNCILGQQDTQLQQAETTLTVDNNGTTVIDGTNILNFTGNVNVIETSSGNVNIDILQGLGGQGSGDIVISFGGHSKDYVRYKKEYYETQRQFIYRGSNTIGSPINIKGIISVKDSNKTGALRLYDSTNGLVICELLNVNNNAFQIIDLGAISNIPNSEAIVEIQGKRIISGAEVRLAALILEF